MPLRVGDDLLSSARVAAEASGRSAAQQIGYWAKLGRELERSGSLSVREVAEVLAGARAYDELAPKEQAIVRAEWAEQVEQRLAALDLGADFAAEGRAWVELAPDGSVIRHPATAAKASRAPKPAAKARTRKPAAKGTASERKATTRETAAKKAAQQPKVAVARAAKQPAARKKAAARPR
jgi:hypothetical protein